MDIVEIKQIKPIEETRDEIFRLLKEYDIPYRLENKIIEYLPTSEQEHKFTEDLRNFIWNDLVERRR